MYHIIRLHFLVDWDFLHLRIIIFIVFTVVRVPHGPGGARPQHPALHTARTHRRDTCLLFPFPMPALSPPAMLRGAFPKGIA